MVVKIPRDKIRKIDIVNIKGGLTASQVYKKYKPDYMINLALYDMASGTNITHLKDEGVLSGYLFSNEGIGIKEDNNILWTTKDDNSVRDYVSGSPVLLKNGKKDIDWGNKVSQYVCGSHKRSAIGFNGKEIILYTSSKEMTLNELQNVLIEYGCECAINCDGGGSCHLQKHNNVITKSTRKNASWLLVYVEEVKDMPKICLDYGHGASTAGKRSPDGNLLEYEFNRDVGRRIKTILENHNVEVIETVEDDTDLALSSRCGIANFHDCDYFVSIHANAYNTSWNDVSGWEIYIIGKGGKAEKLAEKIHKYSKDLGLKDRGIKIGNFQVLRDTNMPAVLIEHGFYTNKEECEKLKSDSFRQKCAECDAKGILEQLGIEYKETVKECDKLVLKINEKWYTINGVKKEMEVPPRIENGRTLVTLAPLRELGLTVEWNGETQEVTITKGGK
jgi:N-acetylmuramoyl-L-alanine amidase